MVFPPVHPFSGIEGAVEDLGDLEFLRDKQLAGDLVSATGIVTTASPVTIVSIIPAVGKTFFIAKSNVVQTTEGSGVQTGVASLQNDGTIKDTRRARMLDVETVNLPGTIASDSLVGDGAKEYRMQKTTGLAIVHMSATILGWIQDT